MNRSSSPAWFGGVAILTFLAILGVQGAWPVTVLVHLLLAVGVFPLILAAMIYFTPVLTRSGSVPFWVHLLPWLAMLAGGVGWLAVVQTRWLLGVAAPMAWLIVVVALGWMIHRAVRTLGSPHPGLYWYLAALVGLMLGLLVMLASLVWPEQWLVWRALHRHLNLLGFVGLAAVGTIQVLLPTVGGYADPLAALRLRFDLKLAVAGALLMAGGAAFWPMLSWLGLLMWGWVLGRLVRGLHGHLARIVRANGAAISLIGALVGFWCALCSTLWQEGQVDLPLYVIWFLFPLVTGALAHLLPVWWWPGRATAQRDAAQRHLGQFALLRVAAFWLGGVGLMMDAVWGLVLVGAPLILFLLQAVWLGRGRFGRQAV